MSLTAAAKTWITVFWLWVTDQTEAVITGWSRTGQRYLTAHIKTH